MVDIHCHIVPGVDDGAKDLDMALAMIEVAKSEGVTAILTTPHIRGSMSDLAIHDIHRERFALLKEAASGIDLYLGGEVRVTAESHLAIQAKEFTSNEALKYILLELPFDHIPRYFSQLLFDYRLAGITPVIAHPERNVSVLRQPELAIAFVEQGAHLQLTSACLLGDLGEAFEKCAWKLLRAGLISFVASDAHNLTSRPFTHWKRVYECLQEEEQRADEVSISAYALTTGNPSNVCTGKPLPEIVMDDKTRALATKALSTESPAGGVKRKRFFFF